MTALRLTFGVDPGLSGAIAVLLDGEPDDVFDMPTIDDPKATRGEVGIASLATVVCGLIAQNPGAYVSACVEKVRAMPNKVKGGVPRTMGAQSSFNFGDGFGQVKALFRIKGIPMQLVESSSWKRHYCLTGQEKDAARILAIKRFPSMADQLNRKKDNGRADALLIALWHETHEMAGNRTR
jgi:crossover junction endodeoxyribonuclease RuvC